MNTSFLTGLILFIISFNTAFGLQSRAVEKNLKADWLVYEDGAFVPYGESDSDSDVIYIRVNARDLKGKYLHVHGIRPFNLFVNNNLAGRGDQLLLKVDSLAGAFSSHNLLVAIHQAHSRHDDLSTTVESISARDPLTDGLVKRSTPFFRDFGVLGMLVLLVVAVVIVRLNPKLTADYFSVAGIFSTRETQDSQVSTRIGSSTNILFYAYCSMLLSYYLIVTFHFTRDIFPIANSFEGHDFLSVVLQWLKLSAYVLVVFFLKIILIFGASYLFGIPEIAGIHFFNWVRLLLIFFGLLTIILFIYFVWHGQSSDVHSVMLKLLGWIIGGWIILLFLKLSGNVSASMFHLFSYICATELIPFLFIIKVLYK